MSRKIRKQIRVELEQLDRLLTRHPGLIEKCRTRPPTDVETDALAVLLHSFYSGVENVFKRVSLAMDGNLPEGEFWQTVLLDSMTHSTPTRPAVISEDLRDILKAYLDFRHVFRHAYSFELQWGKMAPLVLGVEGALQRLQEELERFLRAIEPNDEDA